MIESHTIKIAAIYAIAMLLIGQELLICQLHKKI